MKIRITGKPWKVSKEEVRSIIEATHTVLRYHKNIPLEDVSWVQFVNKFSKKESDRSGDYLGGKIRVLSRLNYSNMVTVLIHEILHAYFDFPEGSEKVTSTLTARLKPDVIEIANVLVKNIYKRAGYFAHTKISYAPSCDALDHYDADQWHRNHQDSEGGKFRRRRRR